MSSSNSAHLWSIEAHTASADSSNPDTDESWRICTSSNALFRAQPADFHSDLVDANDSPDSFSACVPNLLTEPHPPAGDSAISQVAGNRGLGSLVISLDSDCDSSLFGIARHPFTVCPWTSNFSGCTASDDVLSHTLLTQGNAIAGWDDPKFDFELCPSFVSTLDLDFCSTSLGSQFELNSTQFADALLQIDSCAPPIWSRNVDFEISVRDLQCDWPQCSSLGVFDGIEKHKSHIKHHARDVSNNWSPGRKCTWHKCSSKASHRSRNLFEAHLNNIHVNPLVCTVKHCKHKTPFRANHDLQRHIATAHNIDSKYTCPYTYCAGRGFIRKDKWMSHLKEHHDTEPCPYAHCQRRTENIPLHQRSVSKHIGKTHSSFECALKSCKGKISRFAESQLLEHLELHHAMEWVLVLKARDMVKADGDRTLTSDHLLQDLEVRDCKICTEGS